VNRFEASLWPRGYRKITWDVLFCLAVMKRKPNKKQQSTGAGIISHCYPQSLQRVPDLCTHWAFSWDGLKCTPSIITFWPSQATTWQARHHGTILPRFTPDIFFFYYSYVHTRLGSFLPPAPTPSLTTHRAPSLSPPPPQYPAETILPLSLILL
jgi:hypothetical protein